MNRPILSPKAVPLAVAFLENIDFVTGAKILRLFDDTSIRAIIQETANQMENDANGNNALIDEWYNTRRVGKNSPLTDDINDNDFYKHYRIPEELSFLDEFDITILIRCIERLPPLTITYFVANLAQEKSLQLFDSIDDNQVKSEVIEILADFQVCLPHEIKEVVTILKNALTDLFKKVHEDDGVEALLSMMDKVSNNQRAILGRYMDAANPEISRHIGNALPDFMRIVYLDDKAIQLVLARLEDVYIALALKNLKEEIAKRIFRNVSTKRRKAIIEKYKATKSHRVDDIYGAREIIGLTIRSLLDKGAIELSHEQIH